MMNERAVVESTGVFGVLQHIFCSPGGAKVAGVGGWGGGAREKTMGYKIKNNLHIQCG